MEMKNTAKRTDNTLVNLLLIAIVLILDSTGNSNKHLHRFTRVDHCGGDPGIHRALRTLSRCFGMGIAPSGGRISL